MRAPGSPQPGAQVSGIGFGYAGGDIGVVTIGIVIIGIRDIVGETAAVVTVKFATGTEGNIWLCTTKLPVGSVTVHFADRVMDCPGLRIRLTMYCGSTPSFDRQITLSLCMIENPSTLGPSMTVSFCLDVFVMVSVIVTTWPGL